MRRFVLVAVLLAAGCGGGGKDALPEATWTVTAEHALACGPGGRYVGDSRVPWDQWCIWECATYQGAAERVAVRLYMHGTDGPWAEYVYTRPCGYPATGTTSDVVDP